MNKRIQQLDNFVLHKKITCTYKFPFTQGKVRTHISPSLENIFFIDFSIRVTEVVLHHTFVARSSISIIKFLLV